MSRHTASAARAAATATTSSGSGIFSVAVTTYGGCTNALCTAARTKKRSSLPSRVRALSKYAVMRVDAGNATFAMRATSARSASGRTSLRRSCPGQNVALPTMPITRSPPRNQTLSARLRLNVSTRRCDSGSRYGKNGRSVANDIFTADVRAEGCDASILNAVIFHCLRT